MRGEGALGRDRYRDVGLARERRRSRSRSPGVKRERDDRTSATAADRTPPRDGDKAGYT